MNRCFKCDGILKIIGKERKNGTTKIGNYNKDWDTRKYHKKCYKEIKDRQLLIWKLEGKLP